MQNIIDYYKNVALSDKQVLELVEGNANIVLYPELHRYSSLNQILDPYGACFLLYEAEPRSGHWCCLVRTHDELGPLIEFMDPYGKFPDSQRHYIPENFRKISNQDCPHLTYLMLESPEEMSYNQYPFQKHGDQIRSCGRWCALRIMFKDLSLQQFKELFLGKYSDDVATFLTAF
jgi:hypothetical protein